MELNANDLLAVALSKAVTDAIPAEMQKEIFAKALHGYLFYRDRDGNSTLTKVFTDALNKAATALAEQILAEPKNQEAVRAIIMEAFTKMCETGELTQKITHKMSGALRW